MLPYYLVSIKIRVISNTHHMNTIQRLHQKFRAEGHSHGQRGDVVGFYYPPDYMGHPFFFIVDKDSQ